MGKKEKSKSIAVNLVSRHKLEEFTSDEKIQFILKEVQNGKVLVLEQGLTALEQSDLIEKTMKEIKQDTFIGIEMEGYGEERTSFLKKVLGIIQKPRMTVIGPAHLLKTINKDNNMIETKIIPGKGG
ncbi:MAG: DUF2073 domain-containing protein [Candidatus Thermoplasmatota archaeon]|nr:DUF2073 domain-containing protein [Candidatus Thermoplasmatota archaeon]